MSNKWDKYESLPNKINMNFGGLDVLTVCDMTGCKKDVMLTLHS